jgi:hypothetical protein
MDDADRAGPHGCHGTAKTTGEKCRNHPPPGSPCCWLHGGRAPQVRRKAAERVAEAKAMEVWQRYSPNGDSRPVDVLAELAHLVAVVTHFARFAEARLAALGEDDWQPGNEATMAEVRMFRSAQEAAGRLLTDVARLGIEATVTSQAERVERSRAERIVEAFEVALDVLDLSDGQRARAGAAMAALLLHLADGAA